MYIYIYIYRMHIVANRNLFGCMKAFKKYNIVRLNADTFLVMNHYADCSLPRIKQNVECDWHYKKRDI
jgi:hypothetical protein